MAIHGLVKDTVGIHKSFCGCVAKSAKSAVFSNKIVKYIRIYGNFCQIQLKFCLFACGSPGPEWMPGGKLASAGRYKFPLYPLGCEACPQPPAEKQSSITATRPLPPSHCHPAGPLSPGHCHQAIVTRPLPPWAHACVRLIRRQGRLGSGV